MASHTRGPWTIAHEGDDGEPYDDGVRIDSPEGPVAFNVIDCSADVISAAPELLESCLLLLSIVEAEYEADECQEDLDSWRAAIAAAKAAIDKSEGLTK